MLYVSTSCIPKQNADLSIQKLVKLGFNNFELSGGYIYDEDLIKKLSNLKDKYQLKFLVHNYFPIPKNSFVMNLGSLNKDVYKRTLEHCKAAIKASEILGGDKYAVHGAYLIDISENNIGQPIPKTKLNKTSHVLEQFAQGLNVLESFSERVSIYIENNVLSLDNFRNFNEVPPLFFTSWEDFKTFEKLYGKKVNILLDYGHLKVSSNTLSINFLEQLKNFGKCDYIHLSGNNSISDTNETIKLDDIEKIKLIIEKNSDITIEVYSGESQILRTRELIEDFLT